MVIQSEDFTSPFHPGRELDARHYVILEEGISAQQPFSATIQSTANDYHPVAPPNMHELSGYSIPAYKMPANNIPTGPIADPSIVQFKWINHAGSYPVELPPGISEEQTACIGAMNRGDTTFFNENLMRGCYSVHGMDLKPYLEKAERVKRRREVEEASKGATTQLAKKVGLWKAQSCSLRPTGEDLIIALDVALLHGKLNNVAFLIASGATLDETASIFACGYNGGSVPTFERLKKRGLDVNWYSDRPLLHRVLHDFGLTRWFLKEGADPNTTSIEGETALDAAIKSGNVPLLKLLIDYGALTTLPNVLHHAVVNIAEDKIFAELIKFLVKDRHVDINTLAFINHPEFINPRLLKSTVSSDSQVLKVIPQHNKTGTVLHWAVKKHERLPKDLGMLRRVTWLLSKGADPNIADIRGRRPLEYARDQHMTMVLEHYMTKKRRKNGSSYPEELMIGTSNTTGSAAIHPWDFIEHWASEGPDNPTRQPGAAEDPPPATVGDSRRLTSLISSSNFVRRDLPSSQEAIDKARDLPESTEPTFIDRSTSKQEARLTYAKILRRQSSTKEPAMTLFSDEDFPALGSLSLGKSTTDPKRRQNGDRAKSVRDTWKTDDSNDIGTSTHRQESTLSAQPSLNSGKPQWYQALRDGKMTWESAGKAIPMGPAADRRSSSNNESSFHLRAPNAGLAIPTGPAADRRSSSKNEIPFSQRAPNAGQGIPTGPSAERRSSTNDAFFHQRVPNGDPIQNIGSSVKRKSSPTNGLSIDPTAVPSHTKREQPKPPVTTGSSRLPKLSRFLSFLDSSSDEDTAQGQPIRNAEHNPPAEPAAPIVDSTSIINPSPTNPKADYLGGRAMVFRDSGFGSRPVSLVEEDEDVVAPGMEFQTIHREIQRRFGSNS